MIQITDMTLACLDDYNPTGEQLRRLCGLLLRVGSDWLELSVRAYEAMGDLPEQGKYLLRCHSLAQTQRYPQFSRYVLRKTGLAAPANVLEEVRVNDICELNFLNQFFSLENVRIRGLDDVLAHDYPAAFSSIRGAVKGKVQLCPENEYDCATAIAVEWVLQGGREIAASFAGMGGVAPLEEVLIALHITARYRPTLSVAVFADIRRLMEEITGQRVHPNKPVIGEAIFDMEAGIHADGIAKNPLTYEPFHPELVGGNRRLVVGKHSGSNAMMLKLNELKLDPSGIDPKALLARVRSKSIALERSLTDAEFLQLYHDTGKPPPGAERTGES